jgi:hypothetical protein
VRAAIVVLVTLSQTGLDIIDSRLTAAAWIVLFAALGIANLWMAVRTAAEEEIVPGLDDYGITYRVGRQPDNRDSRSSVTQPAI